MRILDLGVAVSLPEFAFGDIAKWGFNAVRLRFSWQDLEPSPPTHRPGGGLVHHWDTAFLETLDHDIAGFRAHGVAVVLLMNQYLWSPAFTNLAHADTVVAQGNGMPAWLYPNGGGLCAMARAEKAFFVNGTYQPLFRSAWRMLAHRYAKNRTVIGADILNEPYDVLSASYPCVKGATPMTMHLAQFYERTAAVLHRANPHLLLIFEEQQSRRTGAWALMRRPRLPRALGVFSMHYYSGRWDPTPRDRLHMAYARAQRWNLPTYVGEFTMFNRSVTGHTMYPGWKSSSVAMMRYCKDHGIGWSILGYGADSFQEADNIRQPKAGVLPIVRGGF